MGRILIADDDRDYADAMSMVLVAAGHQVDAVHTIADAEHQLRSAAPDLLILDVMFPEDESAGFRLARRLRHFLDDVPDIPVLMVTAINRRFPLGFGTRDIDSEWLPVSDFVEKPVDLTALVTRVEELLPPRPDPSPPSN